MHSTEKSRKRKVRNPERGKSDTQMCKLIKKTNLLITEGAKLLNQNRKYPEGSKSANNTITLGRKAKD